jgi:hypothetical protein
MLEMNPDSVAEECREMLISRLCSVVFGRKGLFMPGHKVVQSQSIDHPAINMLVMGVDSKYRRVNKARFLCNPNTADRIRKLRDSNGHSIIYSGISKMKERHMMGFPVEIRQDVPDNVLSFGTFTMGATLTICPVPWVTRTRTGANVEFNVELPGVIDLTDAEAYCTLEF